MFPTKKHEIETSLEKSQVIDRLQSVVGTAFDGSEFGGTVEEGSFKIYKKPTPFVRNSSNPIIIGKIEKGEKTTKIKLTLRMHLFVITFFTAWLLILSACLISGIVLLTSNDMENGLTFTLGGVALFIVQQLITRIPFHLSAKKSISLLESILK